MLLETVLIQRFVLFLGFPTYALSVVLFALLVFTGIGSALSARVPRTRRGLVTVLGVVVALVVVAAVALQPVLESLIALPFGARVAISVAVLAPVGLGLGMPMPLGLARFADLHPRSVAYAWGVNGMASVLASVLGVAIAINFGYRVACLVAAGFYALALAHAAAGRWAERAPVDDWGLGEPVGRPPSGGRVSPSPPVAGPGGGRGRGTSAGGWRTSWSGPGTAVRPPRPGSGPAAAGAFPPRRRPRLVGPGARGRPGAGAGRVGRRRPGGLRAAGAAAPAAVAAPGRPRAAGPSAGLARSRPAARRRAGPVLARPTPAARRRSRNGHAPAPANGARPGAVRAARPCDRPPAGGRVRRPALRRPQPTFPDRYRASRYA